MPDSLLSLTLPIGGARRLRRGDWVPLFLLMGAAAVPIIIFAMVMLAVFNRQMESAFEASLRRMARSMVAAVDARLGAEVAALQALATGGRDEFAEQAGALMALRPTWLGLRRAATDGTTIDVSGRALPPLDAATIRRVAERRRPEVGTIQPGEDAFVPIYVPVFVHERVEAVIAAALSSSSVANALLSQSPPADWTVVALDDGLNIAGRNPSHARYVGSRPTPSLLEQLQGRSEQFLFAVTKEGGNAYTATSHSAAWGWTIAVGAPAETVEQPMRKAMFLLTAGGLVALAIAVWVGGTVARAAVRRQEAERRLVAVAAQQKAERRLTDIASNFPGIIYRRVLHPDGRVTYPYVSPGVDPLGRRFLVEGDQAALESLNSLGFIAEDRDGWHAAVLESSRTLQPFHFEGRANTGDEEVRWIRTMARPSLQSDGAVVWDGVALDITDMKQAEQHLAASLAEKDAMLREIHHRVRNNLQVVSSLIQIETFQIADADARRRLSEVSRRIGALGHVHELLYHSTDFARIDCGEHLRRLCVAVQDACDRNGAMVSVAAQALHCDIDTAIPFGLIAHELVTQELLYTAEARVRLERREDGAVVLTMTSDADGQRHELAALLGRILHALAAQIDARLSLHDEGGVATLRIDGRRFAVS